MMEDLMRQYRFGTWWRSSTDDFEGEVVGWYVTREEKCGLVMQMANNRVVHVYNVKWLSPLNRAPVECEAHQCNDQMVCIRCQLVWDINDRDAPACRGPSSILPTAAPWEGGTP